MAEDRGYVHAPAAGPLEGEKKSVWAAIAAAGTALARQQHSANPSA